MAENDPSQVSHSHDPQLPSDAPAELPVPRLPSPPFWMLALAIISVVITWLPLSIIARARVSTTTDPRIQLAQDMGVQPKEREQQTNFLFADQREMRPKIPGTVSRTDLEDDDGFYRGFSRKMSSDGKASTVNFEDGFPKRVLPINSKLLKRGEQRFNIYCYVCHGYDGSGHGPVNQRAVELQMLPAEGMSWTQAAQLTSDLVRKEPNGKIFNTITNGIRSMPSYGAQIPPEDRWAIVAYVRALQFSQCAPASIVPSDQTIQGN